MTSLNATPSELVSPRRALPAITVGSWVFRHRTWIPVPFALVLVGVRVWQTSGAVPLIAGTLAIALGEAIRLWAVRHIGVVSRTRTTRLGQLVTTGPYAFTRNPLYIGNVLLWTGFVLLSGLIWMLPVAWLLFAMQQTAIVPWEEALLLQAYPEAYRAYCARVPRWWPAGRRQDGSTHRYPWSQVLFSERGTLLAIFAMSALMFIKHRYL